jgi:bacterial/archaeal transporter family protein
MHLPSWFWFTLLALICFGVVGLFQKLSTDAVSAESALIWLIAGFFLLQPFMYSGPSVFGYSLRSLAYVLLAGVCNGLGSWAVLAAMKHGGKASIVVPLTATYPMVVVLFAPMILHERISVLQGIGVLCGAGGIFLLSR